MRIARRALAAEVADSLERLGISFMLAGAGALAVHGFSRATRDIDFLTSQADSLEIDWQSGFQTETGVEVRKGDSDDPLAGVVRFTREGQDEVDLVVVRWKWQQQMIERSEMMDLGGFQVRVPKVEDLVLLKIEAGSFLDQRDAAQLIQIHGPAMIDRVDESISDLPDYVRAAWEKLRSELEK